MSKEEFDTHLRFGQAVQLMGFREEEQKGMMCAKGYADTIVKYETYEDILFFQNYRDGIFQMLPAGNFQINDEIKKPYVSDEKKESLKYRARSELSQYFLNIESKSKELIYFGMDVVFKHLDSESYLTGTISPSDGNSGAFSVEVTKELSSGLIFKLLPYRSFEFEGTPIPFDSPVIIYNLKNQTYLTFERKKLVVEELKLKQTPIPSLQSFQIPVRKKSVRSRTFRCVSHSRDLSSSLETPMPWKFKLHMKDVVNDILIQHDIGYLQHTGTGGVITAFNSEIGMKEAKEHPNTFQFYDCLWEFEKHTGENEYIFRHLMSGMTMGVSRKEVNGVEVKTPVLLEINDQTTLGSLDMRLAKKGCENLASESFVSLGCDGDYFLDVKQTEELKVELGLLGMLVHGESIAQHDFEQALLKEQNYVRKDLQFSRKLPEHCFMIMELDEESIREVLFTLSFHETLINFIEELKWGTVYAEKKIDYYRMLNLSKSLNLINAFVKGCTEEEAEFEWILPIKKRQLICKDLGISELLFQLIFYMKKNVSDSIYSAQSKRNEKIKFQELYIRCYKIIRCIIKDNYLFKIHVSKWVDIVLSDAKEQVDNETIHLALEEILRGNVLVINAFIRESLVSSLAVSFCEKCPQHRLLRIFRAFCIVDQLPVQSNQINILNYFIKKIVTSVPQISFDFKKLATEAGERVLVMSYINRGSPKLRSLEDFYKLSLEDEGLRSWQYFIEFLNLLADLCYGGNKVCKNVVEKIVGLNTLCLLLEDPVVEQLGALESVVRLAHYCYVEDNKYPPITRINKLGNYNTVSFDRDIPRTTTDPLPQDTELKRVLDFVRQYLGKTGVLKVSNYKQNCDLIHVLELFLTTLREGMWRSTQELKELAAYILKILQNDKESIVAKFDATKEELGLAALPEDKAMQIFSQHQASLSVPSSSNLIVIKCKKVCTQILEVIMDLEVDVRVQLTCAIFKDINDNGVTPEELASIAARAQDSGVEERISEAAEAAARQDKVLTWLDLWKERLEAMLSTRGLIDLSMLDAILLELSQYNNAQLLNASISIMRRTYDQRNECYQNFSNILLTVSGNLMQLAQFAQARKNKFYNLDSMVTKATLANQASLYNPIWKEGTDPRESGLIQDLYYLMQLAKHEYECSRLDSVPRLRYDYFGPKDRIYSPFNERESNERWRQNVLQAAGIHHQLLGFLLQCKVPPSEDLPQKLINAIYFYITLVIWNNHENKKEYEEALKQLEGHVEYNLGYVDFLREMYDNNKALLYNEGELQHHTCLLRMTINSLSDEQFYKSKLLDTFRAMIFFNEKALVVNQILILKTFQDDEFPNILIQPSPLELEPLIREHEAAYEHALSSGDLHLGPRLTYMYTFFNIFAVLVEDRNMVNIGKCKKMHTIEYLASLVAKGGRCWPLRRNLRCYMNRMYYAVGGEAESYERIAHEYELDNWISDLNHYIQIKIKHPDFVNIRLSNPIRFTYLESYLYLNLEEVLFSMYEVFNCEPFLEALERRLSAGAALGDYLLHNKMIRIVERLGWIRNHYSSLKVSFIRAFIKYIQSIIIKNVVQAFPENVFFKDPALLSKKTAQQKSKLIEATIERIALGDIDLIFHRNQGEEWLEVPLTFLIQEKPQKKQAAKEPIEKTQIQSNREKLLQLLTSIFTKQKNREEGDSNLSVLRKHRTLANSMRLSQNFANFLKQEFLNVASHFSTIDRRSTEVYGSQVPYISLKQYIKTIVEMNSLNPGVLSPQLKKFFLRLLTRFITEKNKKDEGINLPINEWDPEYYEDCKDLIKEEQKFLRECNLAEFIAALLKERVDLDIDLANQTLLFGIAFLLGGFDLCQNSILDKFKADEANEGISMIYELISQLGRLIYKNNKVTKVAVANNRPFAVTIIDTYDYYSLKDRSTIRKNVIEPDDVRELEFKNLCINVYSRAFKFIQLLCESNNIFGKNYIRQQINLDESVKLNSINFIDVAAGELRKLYKILSKSIAPIPLFILDFILEVTQIPVKENQINFMRTTFFEDVCQLESFFSKPENLEARGFERNEETGAFDIDALFEIYGKCINIVRSNLEGNDDEIFQFLDNKLEFRFLVTVVNKSLQDLGVVCKEDLWATVEGQDQQFQDELVCVLDVLMILKHLENKVPGGRLVYAYNNFMNKEENAQTAAVLTEMRSLLLNIEIKNSDGGSQIVYFPKQPLFAFLSAESMDKIMYSVERATQRDKILGLLHNKDEVSREMEHCFLLRKNLNITNEKIVGFKRYANIVSLLINLFMVCFYKVSVQHYVLEYFTDPLLSLVLFLLCLGQLSLTCVFLYFWGLAKLPLAIPRTEGYSPDDYAALSRLGRAKYALRACLEHEPSSAQTLVYVLAAFGGAFWRAYMYTFHLLDIFSTIDTLQNVFAAVISTSRALLTLSFMGVVFVFIFCSITFQNYQRNVYSDQKLSEMCIALHSCIMDLYVSGAIGQTMDEFELKRFTYDMIYYLFFDILFSNITSGLMLDAFSSLRDKKNEIDSDKKNTCYICGMPRADIEKSGDFFEDHYRRNHFLWNYIFFIHSLEKKDPTDYTGLEYYIKAKEANDDVSWVPSATDAEFDPSAAIEAALKGLQQNYSEIRARQDEISGAVSALIDKKAV